MGLIVSDLSCTRGGRLVLHGLDFGITDGESLILRGPNGAGKSTLLRAIAGLVPVTGCIEIDGRTADRDTRAELVAYAGHLDAVKLQLTVAENLGFWAGLLGGSERRALAAFDLERIADRPAHLLSAGQKRRLGLTRVLLSSRRLWLLDEPTVSLDATAVAHLLDAVRRHCAAGGIAVFATHAPLDLTPSRELLLTSEASIGAASGADPFLSGIWT